MGHKTRVSSILATLLLASAPLAAHAASETWGTYCAHCHGDDGKADTEKGKEKGARDLTNKKWQAAHDDARLEKSITNGKGKMPGFKDKLSAEEIKALVAEVRGLAK